MNERISECVPLGKEKGVMVSRESLKSSVEKQNICGEKKNDVL